MSDNQLKEDKTVQSVGSSWIVCKSKSRSGHVYYFNTLTGETVWNLSDAEIEKAKDIRKQIDTHHFIKSPELKQQPPMVYPVQCKESANQTTQINNQVSTQQIHNLAFPQFANSGASYTNAINNFTALNTLSAFSQGRHDSFNSSMNSLNFNNITSLYNPNVWAVPQQIFIAPTVSPLVKEAQASLNLGYNNIHQTIPGQNISAPFHCNYVVTNEIPHSPTKKTLHNYRNTFQNVCQRRPSPFNCNSKNRNDLRTKISINKRFQFNKCSPFTSRAHNLGNRQQQSNPNFNTRQGCVPNGGSKQLFYEETSSRLDLTPLKKLAAANVHETWFIIVDMDVIINEFKFLNTLSDSDAQCHLVVPQYVMSELESYVATSQDVQARRIQRFLSQQIEHGDVMIAEEPSDDDDSNSLLSTCLRLSEENYHVVLLTNDSELVNHKDSIPIAIFTPDEVKILLNINSNKNHFPISKPSTFIPNRPFKRISVSSESDSSIPKSMTINRNPNPPSLPKVVKECSAKATITAEPIKKTMDAAIQTEFSDFNPTNITESDRITKDVQNQTCDTDKNKETESNTDIVTSVNAEKCIKKRTIQIKRTASKQPLLAPPKTDQKSNFKWRRRKNPVSQVKETVAEHPADALLSNNEVAEDSLKGNKSEDIVKSNTSVAASDSSIVSKNFSDSNIIIEETSTSGILNTASNVDVEIVNTQELETQFDFGNGNEEMKTVLYEVDSPSMEEYLVMKCDEWVSRFIQIMEEALTVVLQHDPPFSHDSLPPPWTLYEAAQCIKMKFNTNMSIKDAAFKLSNVLLKVSDRNGKINSNIKPAEYMEMYSFGVYLLDTITAMVDNCEDLQIGVESLKKLLNDIQNPNLDNSTQESFADVSLDHVSVQISSGTTSQSCLLTPEKILSPEKSLCRTDEKYNLRSGKKRKLFKEDDVAPQSVKVVRTLNPESSFFTSLKLQKNINISNLKTLKQTILNDKLMTNDLCNDQNAEVSNLEKVEDKVAMKSDIVSSSEGENGLNVCNGQKDVLDEDGPTEPLKPLKTLFNSNQSDDQENIQDNVVIEPRVLFRFTKCSEIEEKLKKKSVQDYEEDYEYPSDEYDSEVEFDENAGHDEGDIDMEDAVDDNELTTANSPEVPESLSNDNNINKFKYVVGMILQEIKHAFYSVKNICENYFEESKTPQGSKMKRIELRMKVKNASAHINDMCKSLDSMLESEAKYSNNNMEALFKKAGYQDFYLDDELKAEYSATIAKCKSYAEVFLKCIQNILSTLNC